MVVGEAQWRDLKPLSAQMFVERFRTCDAGQRQDGARRGTLLSFRKQRAALAIAKRGEEEFLRRRKAEALPDVGALRFVEPFGAFRDDDNLRPSRPSFRFAQAACRKHEIIDVKVAEVRQENIETCTDVAMLVGIVEHHDLRALGLCQ